MGVGRGESGDGAGAGPAQDPGPPGGLTRSLRKKTGPDFFAGGVPPPPQARTFRRNVPDFCQMYI